MDGERPFRKRIRTSRRAYDASAVGRIIAKYGPAGKNNRADGERLGDISTATDPLAGRRQRCNNVRPNWREAPMRVVTLEEHFSVPALASRIDKDAMSRRGYRPRKLKPNAPNPLALLPEIGEQRLKSMDDAGITMQVLSSSGPGPDIVPGPDGIAMAREMNDHLAKVIAGHPDRFAGFATLPTQSPDACAPELARAVKDLGFVGAMVYGTTEGRFLDHPSYDGLLAAAVELDVPIYIHPHIPPEPVRKAYFSDLPEGAGRVLETAGWGWHSETAVHVLRMVVAGTLDRHPRLKLIIGHMGEMLPMMMDRADTVFAADTDHLKRPISRTILDQVWITNSGIFNEPPFLAALLTFGIDRIMFSVDYPYSANALGRDFLDRISLAPADMAKLTHGNADALLKLKVPSR
jgi:uncharacterized protein